MNENKDEPDFYTIEEFAKKLRLHPNTIRRSIKCGRITAFRAGFGKRASYRIAHSEIGRIQLFDLEAMIEKIVIEKQGEKHE